MVHYQSLRFEKAAALFGLHVMEYQNSSVRSQSLQNELDAAISDKKYLSSMVAELRHGQEGATKNAEEIGQLKEENEWLQREIKKMSARRQSADMIDISEKKVVEKQLLEDALKKNSALEQKIREIL